ncbi:uncharacterized protein BT62DRAFT_999886 [Guyanagaster necrorhizus]|uniref:Uncharacterized protein n=1 Tax=Guyanagaster necrorhizus TaxID=856835 RepID=A0A9P7W6G6_9AGAR|nr:uncharacterized protein BT62DRAFT_999886 [Guyanagaster necrorhizus MCA 3950]KAG7452126.1 hypothetical protein BT62DRAFT_999886 [Guyanagaster necrorhizus MCA 3950]
MSAPLPRLPLSTDANGSLLICQSDRARSEYMDPQLPSFYFLFLSWTRLGYVNLVTASHRKLGSCTAICSVVPLRFSIGVCFFLYALPSYLSGTVTVIELASPKVCPQILLDPHKAPPVFLAVGPSLMNATLLSDGRLEPTSLSLCTRMPPLRAASMLSATRGSPHLNQGYYMG